MVMADETAHGRRALPRPLRPALGTSLTFVVVSIVPVFLALVALLAWQLPRDEITHPLDEPQPAVPLTDR
jgi:hypothetical protein